MPNIRHLNQNGPFWDFIASLEDTELGNHPLYRAFVDGNNYNGNNQTRTETQPEAAATEQATTAEKENNNEKDHNMTDAGAADPDASVPQDAWDPFGQAFQVGSGFPFARGFPVHPRGGFCRGRGGFGGSGRDHPWEWAGFHDGDRRHRGPPPPPGPPAPPADAPDGPPPPPIPGQENEPEEHEHETHRHGHGHGRMRGGSRGGQGRGGRGGRRGGNNPWGGNFNMNQLAEFLQSQIFGGNYDNSRGNVDNTGASGSNDDFSPPVDVFDTEPSYIIDVSLPGAKKSDVAVSWDAEKSELNVTGVVHRNGDEEFMKTLALDERKVGAFARKVKLGSRANPAKVDADGITAKLEDGVLRVVVPKEEKEFEVVHRVEVD